MAAPPDAAARRRLAALALAAGLALAPVLPRPAPLLVWNLSASLPEGAYLVLPWVRPGPGQLAALRPPPAQAEWLAARRYLGRRGVLLKPVAAGAGQVVCRAGLQLSVDGRPAARARPRDRRGRPLPAWSGCRRLARGELLLLAASPDSLDGRYLGPAREDQVLGRAWRLRPPWAC